MKTLNNSHTPTPRQIKERNQAWADALRLNPKKATGFMRDKEGGRCCLAVAVDVAKDFGFPAFTETSFFPSAGVYQFFGWDSPDPLLGFNNASHLNDGNKFTKELSHKEIANLVEKEFCK